MWSHRFEYTALIWSVLYGWLFWREWPDPVSWLGIVIIVGAGTYAVLSRADRGRNGSGPCRQRQPQFAIAGEAVFIGEAKPRRRLPALSPQAPDRGSGAR